jgi:hypothetical protein
MPKFRHFDYVELGGERVWLYKDRPDHTELRIVNPGKYGREDYRATFNARAATLDLNPTMPAALAALWAMMYSHRRWPAVQFYDLDPYGYAERLGVADDFEDGIWIVDECAVNWHAFRGSRDDRSR